MGTRGIRRTRNDGAGQGTLKKKVMITFWRDMCQLGAPREAVETWVVSEQVPKRWWSDYVSEASWNMIAGTPPGGIGATCSGMGGGKRPWLDNRRMVRLSRALKPVSSSKSCQGASEGVDRQGWRWWKPGLVRSSVGDRGASKWGTSGRQSSFRYSNTCV